MDIYIVVTDGRGGGIDVTPFTDQAAAVAFAGQQVQDCARHLELIEPEDCELNDAMRASGWIWHCRYGVEGDSVRVIRRELREDAPGRPVPENPSVSLITEAGTVPVSGASVSREMTSQRTIGVSVSYPEDAPEVVISGASVTFPDGSTIAVSSKAIILRPGNTLYLRVGDDW